jgi:hypothetical protein
MAATVLRVQIQKRDLELLELLLHSRILTLRHAAVLSFDGNKEAAKKRIQKLKAAGLILQKPRKVAEKGVLYISKKGFECLCLHEALPGEDFTIRSFTKRAEIGPSMLPHEIAVLDVKAAFHEDVKNHPHLSIAEFSTWPRLYEFSVRDNEFGENRLVQPDGFIRIHERDSNGVLWEHMFFLEVDLSTEKLATLAQKLRRYILFYKQGGMAVRFGKEAKDSRDFPFRVLIFCKSAQRVENVRTLLRDLVQTNQLTVLLFTDNPVQTLKI